MGRQAQQRIASIANMLDVLAQAGVSIKSDAENRLDNLATLIEEWNQRINLVSRRDIGRLVDYHFADSLSLLPILQPRGKWKALDIGGSNGLPGIVIGAVTDSVDVTVCDLKRKREPFLVDACQIAGENTKFVMGRADDKAFQAEESSGFDLVIARAVARLSSLVKWSMPLLREGGLLVAYKGSELPKEIHQIEKRLAKLGADLLIVMASPWASWSNPLRRFAIVRRWVGECRE